MEIKKEDFEPGDELKLGLGLETQIWGFDYSNLHTNRGRLATGEGDVGGSIRQNAGERGKRWIKKSPSSLSTFLLSFFDQTFF